MNYLTFYDWDYFATRNILRYDMKYDHLSNKYYDKYYLSLDVIEWCIENVGRVDLEQDDTACRLTFESDGAAIFFAMHYNLEFALRN